MPNLRDAISEAVTSTACSLLGNAGTYARNFENLVDAIAPDTPFPVASPAAGLSAAYGLLCNREPPPLTGPVPFSGGQCVGAPYRVTAEFQYNNNSIANPGGFSTFGDSVNVTGPVEGTFIESIPGRVRLYVVSASGNTLVAGVNGSTDPGVLTAKGDRITNIIRLSGGADNCGDPDPLPVIPDPDPTSDDIDITYENDEGDTITNNFTINFGDAFIDVDYQVNIPINIQNNNLPQFQINANLNFNTGDINYYAGNPAFPPGSGRPGKDAFKPGPGLPPVPPEVPTGEPAPFPDTSEAETKEIIAGVVVTTSQVPANISKVFQLENPDIYAPNLGYIAFQYQVGNTTAWSSDIPVKNLRNLIPCDWENGAIDVRGTPRPGVVWTITPLYLTRTALDE